MLLTGIALAIRPASARTVYSGDDDHDRPIKETYVLIFGDPRHPGVIADVIEHFRLNLKKGHQEVGMPRFAISDRSGRAMFAIGGYANFRAAYDFNSVLDDNDFITARIPMSANGMNSQRFLMDASTSRLYFKGLFKTGSLDNAETYIETDFRGNNNSLRLRTAYISFRGLTLGQTWSLFSDSGATFNTIDSEGPNGYVSVRKVQVRYEAKLGGHWGLGISVEMPDLTSTGSDFTSSIYQRVPDIPAYVQYSWNEGKSHVRASGVFRTLHYYDDVRGKSDRTFGWGAQFSTGIVLAPAVSLYGQAVYGKALASYVQDLSGSGLDLIPNVNNKGKMIAPETMAWLAGLQFYLSPKFNMSLGYSQVRVLDKNYEYFPDEYKYTQYIAANLFYNISRSFQAGVEYLYGTRHDNAAGSFGRANRVQAMVQFNF